MGILSVRKGKGNTALAIAINSTASVILCNTGGTTESYTVRVKDVGGTYFTVASGDIDSNSDNLEIGKINVLAGEYIELTASNNITIIASLIQEATTASGSLSRDEIEHTGDGIQTTFALPANAPANNKKELTVWVHGVAVSPSLYDLDATKTNIVFTTSIFAGAKIVVRLWKTEA